jgi:hypothetical protein
MRVVEVGGAYSRLPEFLGQKYGVEPWIADDFGLGSNEPMWSRWGDPLELPKRFPTVRYIFRRLGDFAPELPSDSFDRVFSVSTLEHLPMAARLAVLQDMHRILAPGGRELHTIDLAIRAPKVQLAQWAASKLPFLTAVDQRLKSELIQWFDLLKRSGVGIATRIPSLLALLDRATLVESPDVVYRFYPPNNEPKGYNPAASLLLIIEKSP